MITKINMSTDQIPETPIELTLEQQAAYDKIVNGTNILLTGVAGSGKSTIIKKFKHEYSHLRKIATTSTTGISALLIGGRTVHSFAGIGLGQGDTQNLYSKVAKNHNAVKSWRNVEILIIDEISMLSPILFDKLEFIARKIRLNEKPFGGIQLLLCGDFCQLPCVDSELFCFQSEKWSECIFPEDMVYLTQVIRQNNVGSDWER